MVYEEDVFFDLHITLRVYQKHSNQCFILNVVIAYMYTLTVCTVFSLCDTCHGAIDVT